MHTLIKGNIPAAVPSSFVSFPKYIQKLVKSCPILNLIHAFFSFSLFYPDIFLEPITLQEDELQLPVMASGEYLCLVLLDVTRQVILVWLWHLSLAKS